MPATGAVLHAAILYAALALAAPLPHPQFSGGLNGGLGSIMSALSGGSGLSGLGSGGILSLLGGGALPTGGLSGGLGGLSLPGLSGLSIPTGGVGNGVGGISGGNLGGLLSGLDLSGLSLPTGLAARADPADVPATATPNFPITDLPSLPTGGLSIPTVAPTGVPEISGISFPSVPGALPTGIIPGLTGLTNLPKPTDTSAAAIPQIGSASPLDLTDLPLPTQLAARQLGELGGILSALQGGGGNGLDLGGLLTALPTNGIGGISLGGLPTGGLGGQLTALPTGGAGGLSLGGGLPTGGLGGFSLPGLSGLSLPTGGLGGLSLPAGISFPGALPTGGSGGGLSGFPGAGDSALPTPTGGFGGGFPGASGLGGSGLPTPTLGGGFSGASGPSGGAGISFESPSSAGEATSPVTASLRVTDIPDFTPLSYVPPSTTPASSTLRRVIKRDFSSGTQNGLTDGSGCKKVSLIFARGTSETGNMGTVVGPPLAQALADAVGSDNLAVQGVDYAASIAGAIEGGDADGASTMAELATNATTNCPNTQVVLAGYSQGAQVVHKAAGEMDASVAEKIKAVTVFGDPYNGQSIKNIDDSKVKTFCHSGDDVCNGSFMITEAHLTYGSDTPKAASFISGKLS